MKSDKDITKIKRVTFFETQCSLTARGFCSKTDLHILSPPLDRNDIQTLYKVQFFMQVFHALVLCRRNRFTFLLKVQMFFETHLSSFSHAVTSFVCFSLLVLNLYVNFGFIIGQLYEQFQPGCSSRITAVL